jgi:membrane protease YdiL (CAAX protease family)
MVEPAWDLFVALVIVAVMGVIGLARLSAQLLTTEESLDQPQGPAVERGTPLLVNLVITHLGIALAVGAVVLLTGVPLEAIGIGPLPDPVSAVLLGVGIYVVNEGMGVAAKSLDDVAPERYREFLAPEDFRDWALLLGVALPVIAFGEELLFRGALIGGIAAGTSISPWALAVVSSVAFGAAHSAQGSLGIVVTGLLGFVLAVVFVITGDLVLVAIAHYLVNALEFVVHEGLGLEWPTP